jgi:hypothetical protein
MSRMVKRAGYIALCVTALAGPAAQAAVLLEYNAINGGTPADIGWTQFGLPMTNSGGKLVQDNTTVPGENSGEYLSPTFPAGTFTRGGPTYGIEFRVQPLTDVNFVGPAWPELYLTWSDNQFNYNVTVDKFSAGNTSGTGDIVYGQGSFSPAVTGIDWTQPHTIFIGHRGDPLGPSSVFDFYLDGEIKSTITDGSIARTGSFARDAVDFGDGTTGNQDVAAEWYFVRVHNTAVPPPVPEPASLGLLGSAAALALGRRRGKN